MTNKINVCIIAFLMCVNDHILYEQRKIDKNNEQIPYGLCVGTCEISILCVVIKIFEWTDHEL